MGEDQLNELLKSVELYMKKTEGMSPQDLRNWNAPGRDITMGHDEFRDMLRDPKPMTTQKPSLRARLAKLLGHKTASSSAATTLPRAAIKDMNYSRRGRPSWIRRLLGLGARGAKGLSGIGLALDMAANPSELGAGTVEDYFGEDADGLDEAEMMQYLEGLGRGMEGIGIPRHAAPEIGNRRTPGTSMLDVLGIR
jgi:hypothetical protein